MFTKKDYICSPATCSCGIGKCLANITYYWQFSDYVWWNYRKNKKINEKR